MDHIGSNWQSLLQRQLKIVISAVISDQNRNFNDNRQTLFRRWLAIIDRKLRPSALTNSKNCGPEVVANTLCVCEKTDKIWFSANGWLNITNNARWSVFTGPNEAFVSCSHYITRSILSCGQGLILTLLHYSPPPPKKKPRHIQREGEQIFRFFFLKRLYGHYSVANYADLSTHMQIFENIRNF